MQFPSFSTHLPLSSLLILTSLALPAFSQSTNPPCINACPPISSFCNGDETGTALDQCTCNTLLAGNAFIDCVKKCSVQDQAVFAGHLPDLCRAQLFPDVQPVSSSSSGGSASASATGGSASSTGASTTASVTADGTSSAAGGGTPSTTASAGGGGNAASGLQIPMFAAAAGGVMALFVI